MRGSSHEPPKSIDSPRRAKISEKRAVVAGHDEVAAERHVATRADGHAPNLGDRRQTAVGAARARRRRHGASGPTDAGLGHRDRRRKVGAGAELAAGAGEHDQHDPRRPSAMSRNVSSNSSHI